MPPILSPQAFALTQLHLLSLEQRAEISQTSSLLSLSSPRLLARAGLAILNLHVASQRTGLGGKLVVELGVDSAFGGEELPEHGVRTGDVVRVGEQQSGSGGGEKGHGKGKGKGKGKEGGGGVEGVVTRVGERAVWVALGGGRQDNSGDGEAVDELSRSGARLWVVKLANEVTYKRMNWTMKRMAEMGEGEMGPVARACFGIEGLGSPPTEGAEKVTFHDDTLNESQREAIRFALGAPTIALIHGPPGTGKTHTLIELILQLLDRGQRVLVCGPSNISVDNIVERLVPHKVPMVRLGHPARLLPGVLNHSLEVLTRTSEAAAIVKDVRNEIDEKVASIRKTRNGRERKAIYTDLKGLRGEYREREKKCVDTLVRGSRVVLATLHGAGGNQLRGQEFDVVIIDEASQALEAQCWVPLLTAKKAVLAGDHLQLPPTVKSVGSSKIDMKDLKKEDDDLSAELSKLALDDKAKKFAKAMTMESTLFDRLLAQYGPSIKRLLSTQYRMHDAIMKFPSDELYESRLVAADSVKSRLLKDLPYTVSETDDTREPLVFFDTQGGDFPEKAEEDTPLTKSTLLGDSKSNEMEAALVEMHVENLINAGVRDSDIAVITPYNGQLAVLSGLLREKFPGLELGSVDGFQGREKEAVIVGLVRSNADREVGFLGEKRRLNGKQLSDPLGLRQSKGGRERVGHALGKMHNSGFLLGKGYFCG
ncbi:MAG: hypothetical protein Q9227_006717 [Pyrenula ochraceoflavens]